MRITQQQLEATHLLDPEAFITRLCEEFAETDSWVVDAWPPSFVRWMVRYAYDRATIANGLERDIDISLYVTYYFEISSTFDQHPAIVKVLHNPALMPDEKWRELNDESKFATVWATVEQEQKSAPVIPEMQSIEKAYPTTYIMPGFLKLYEKYKIA